MGERGPELVDSAPGYVYRADETLALFEMAKRGIANSDNGETVAELREQNRLLKLQIKVLQEGFQQLLTGQAKGNSSLDSLDSAARRERAA